MSSGMGQTDGKRHREGAASGFWHSGAALIASAAFLFSCTSLAVKLIGERLPTFQIVAIPGLACFLATSVIVKLSRLSIHSQSWRVAGLTLLRGLLGAICMALYYLAIELLPLQDAVTLFFCSPVLAIIFELAVTGESPGWAGAAATTCTVAGVLLVSQPEFLFQHMRGVPGWLRGYSHGRDHGSWAPGAHLESGHADLLDAGTHGEPAGRALLRMLRGASRGSGIGGGGLGDGGGGGGSTAGGINALGAAVATAAAATNAAAFVVTRLIGRSQSTLVLTWWYHAVVVVFASVPMGLRYPAPAVLPSRSDCLLLAAVCVTQFGGQLLLNRGLQLESATRGSAINVLQVLFSFVWDITVLGDRPKVISIAGSVLVAAGVLCLSCGAREAPGGQQSDQDSDLHRRHHSGLPRRSHEGICIQVDVRCSADFSNLRARDQHQGAGGAVDAAGADGGAVADAGLAEASAEGVRGRGTAQGCGNGAEGTPAAVVATVDGDEAGLRQPLLPRSFGRPLKEGEEDDTAT